MDKLNVFYAGWGERWLLGTLADAGASAGGMLFEYSPEAIAQGLEPSPLRLPLPRPGAATVSFRGEPAFFGLPGFIADALPDGWGMLLLDRALRRAGRDPHAISVLERLAMVGDRAIGALLFEPAADVAPEEALSLSELADEVAQVQNEADVSEASLRRLLVLGGSPQGARPKVLMDFDAATDQGRSDASGEPWLIKFPAQGEHREVCAIEELYARIARQGDMDMPDSRFFDLGAKHSAFGVRRFDRDAGQRVPLLSLSALLHADHRLPSLDYETLLLATTRITGDQRELAKAFERCVFNVLMHNRDDHSRNFAYRMNAERRWQLSPAFDLTFSEGPRGQHATSVAGEGQAPTRAHLMHVAQRGGLNAKQAEKTIAHWLEVVDSLPRLAADLPIRRATLTLLQRTVREQQERLNVQR